MLSPSSISNISEREAQALIALLQNAIGKDANNGITIQKAADNFMRAKTNADLSADTLEGYELTLKYLGKVIDMGIDVSCIIPDTLDEFKELLLKRGLKKAGINRRIRELRAIINFCKERGYLSHALIIKELRIDPTPSYIPEAKWDKILSKMKPEHREYISLYLSTGARLNEIYNATLESDNFLVIPADLTKGRRRSIEIELSPENVIIYKKLMRSGLSSSRLSRLFKIACKAAEYHELHFHNIRHSAAIRELIRTKSIYHVSRMLNHSTVKTTEKSYLVHSKRRLKADFKSLYK
ncbi:MAG: tyrosine-type recombinase/integrase [Candidatus Marinimicrobia bacterium]|nr:tyrosine-type recombinase/integrase [Candidatus Neomarinimicrobiota bacterium]